MPWKKKYPGLAGMITPPMGAGGLPPVGQTSEPTALPTAGLPPKLPALPNPGGGMPMPSANDAVKKRALQNIAKGVKGF